jgi:hypothetical protein
MPPRLLLSCLMLAALTACASIGPATLRRDRLDYADALADSAKREALLNIVKLRYADTPNLVSVSQLVAGYTLEGRVDLRSEFFTDSFDLSDDVNFGIGGTFSDRPTVTYTPIRGDDFVRVMLTPIPPSELFAMLAAGAPADVTLGLGVESINGLRNWTADSRAAAWAEPAFTEVVGLLGELRREAALGFRFDTQALPRTVHLLLDDREGRPLDPRVLRLLDLLDLDPGLRSFPIRFGFGDGHPDEIRIYTRSLNEILGNLAAQIEVPASDVADGRTYLTRVAPDTLGALPLVAIRSRALSPTDAFAAVEYRGTWYWIDDNDFASKRVFTILMLLLNLVEKSGEVQLPVITIPTG